MLLLSFYTNEVWRKILFAGFRSKFVLVNINIYVTLQEMFVYFQFISLYFHWPFFSVWRKIMLCSPWFAHSSVCLFISSFVPLFNCLENIKESYLIKRRSWTQISATLRSKFEVKGLSLLHTTLTPCRNSMKVWSLSIKV